MPSQGTKYTAEIKRLRQEGLSDAQIAERLSIGKSIIHRNLYRGRTQQRLAKLMAQAGLYSLKQVLVSCEVGWRWLEIERVKLLEGTSTLTAENLGTIQRNQDKALHLAKAFLGKSFSPEALATADSSGHTVTEGMRTAQQRLKELEAKGVTMEDENE